MGHSRLGQLPASYVWEDVIAVIAGGGDSRAVADATLEAAQKALVKAGRDDGLKHVFYLLAQITLAARTDADFAIALQNAGVNVPSAPSVFDLASGFTEAVDDRLFCRRNKTDFGEMAQMAATESLTALVDRGSTGLFDTTGDEVRAAVRELSTEGGFATLAHDFFSRFVDRFLNYHLSRELSAHVGPGRRFADVNAHEEFRRQLRETSEQTALIVRTFAGQWYGKTRFETGITPGKSRDFIHGAFKKIAAELKARGGAHVA